MSTCKHDMTKVFRRIVSALDQLSDDDVSKLIDDSYNIEFRLTRKRHKEENLSITETDIAKLVSEITALTSREEAQDFLDSKYGTRKALEPIARNLDIPIMKQDKIDVLRDKIIEATVGARIRSQAIQGQYQ
jgi:hypothetical protein